MKNVLAESFLNKVLRFLFMLIRREPKKFLVIGKSLTPICFKNIKRLPVSYTSNQKTWTTFRIIEDELGKWDKELTFKQKSFIFVEPIQN